MTDTRKRQSTNSRSAQRPQAGRAAFTLVELLVVVSIIALLVAILVPALTGVRDRAKAVATRSQITSLGTGLDAFKQESALGGTYPPSQPDWDNTLALDDANRFQIADPLFDEPGHSIPTTSIKHTTGASLLVYALNGADGLGTPGFSDRNNDTKGRWADDFGLAVGGAHSYSTEAGKTGDPAFPRYGPYATSDPLIKSIKSIKQIIEAGVYGDPTTAWDKDAKHLVFTDQWSHPILYFRARHGAKAMVTTGVTPPVPGIYEPYDNLAITGKTNKDGTVPTEGLHPAGGATKKPHWLGYTPRTLTPDLPASKLDPKATGYDANYANSFEQYVWDKSVTQRPTPVNKDTYLLISPGKDGLYGTADDVANFERQ
jgi:prepilin-type N-terminal cleavage/methylation domain-containing protein